MPYAQPTIEFAGLIARLESSPITLLTVIEQGEQRQAAQAMLDRAQALLADLPISTVVLMGQPAEEIVRHSQRYRYDLIVMGERSRGFTDLFLSSVVQHVVRNAHAPVLVVKAARPTLKRILICSAGKGSVEPVIGMGARLARSANAAVTLLHVTNPLPSIYTGLATMEEELTELLQTNTLVARHLREGAAILDQYGVKAEVKLRHGVAAHQILREAELGDYDLVVMGKWPGSSWLRDLLSVDVTREVVDNAGRPILTVAHPT
jgi:nucleotide-binding universal stress UspA family protein